MKFTVEQQAAIDMAIAGGPFSLIAPAGSGKSATALGMASRLQGKRILYLVYNTQARKDAETKFKHLDWVDVRTTSQIAWRTYASPQHHMNNTIGMTRAREIAERYKERMNPQAQHVPAKDVARALKLQPRNFGNGVELDGYQQAVLAADAIEKFCNSNHTEITKRNVRLSIAGTQESSIDAARIWIAKIANILWEQTIKPESNLRFTMNHAFKLVAEGGKNFGYDVILLDEAQDSNDCTMKFVANQKDAQAVLIGDPAQAMYSWRGASDQILRHKGPRLYLTQSFRFGDRVAEEAMKHLPHTKTGVTIKGLSTIKDYVGTDDMESPNAVLCRTNAGVMTYAMSYLLSGKRVAMVKGTKEILDLAYSADKLMKGEKALSLELSAFENWSELVAYTKEPGGGHLKSIVQLIHTYGVHKLIDSCKKMVTYNPRYPKHDVVVGTCHSVKGLEWHNVQIGDDFNEPEPYENPETLKKELGPISPDDAMVHYVAVTRAQKNLDRGGLFWIDKYAAQPAHAV